MVWDNDSVGFIKVDFDKHEYVVMIECYSTSHGTSSTSMTTNLMGSFCKSRP